MEKFMDNLFLVQLLITKKIMTTVVLEGVCQYTISTVPDMNALQSYQIIKICQDMTHQEVIDFWYVLVLLHEY